MSRLAFVWPVVMVLIAVCAVCNVAVAEVRGKSLLVPLEWSVKCQLSTAGRLNLSWGPKSSIEVTIPHFGSLVENPELVVNIGEKNTGGVSFQDHKWWVVDTTRHSESSCRVTFSEMTRSPLGFRVGIVCRNLVPLDRQDGGITDVESEMSDTPIECH